MCPTSTMWHDCYGVATLFLIIFEAYSKGGTFLSDTVTLVKAHG